MGNDAIAIIQRQPEGVRTEFADALSEPFLHPRQGRAPAEPVQALDQVSPQPPIVPGPDERLGFLGQAEVEEDTPEFREVGSVGDRRPFKMPAIPPGRSRVDLSDPTEAVVSSATPPRPGRPTSSHPSGPSPAPP